MKGSSIPQLVQWRQDGFLADEGVIVGSDLSQEWLLPWWWDHYRRYNNHPVAFIDFGMSKESQEWCKEKGALIPLPLADVFVAEKNEVASSAVQVWEKAYGRTFWSHRNGWFKKPLACLLSPFRKTLWIDSDCEIQGSLEPIFEFCKHPSGLAIAREINDTRPIDWIGYNSGVIAFKHGIPVFEDWALRSLERNHEYPGDQDVLSAIIQEQKLVVEQLPLIYNWSRCSAPNPEAVILHWHGDYGKATIAHMIKRQNWECFD